MLPILKGGKATNGDLKSTTIGDNGANIMVWFYLQTFFAYLVLVSFADYLCKHSGTRSGPTCIGPDLDRNCLTL